MSDGDKRQALLKTVVDGLGVAKWPTDDDGSVTLVEAFRTVMVA